MPNGESAHLMEQTQSNSKVEAEVPAKFGCERTTAAPKLGGESLRLMEQTQSSAKVEAEVGVDVPAEFGCRKTTVAPKPPGRRWAGLPEMPARCLPHAAPSRGRPTQRQRILRQRADNALL